MVIDIYILSVNWVCGKNNYIKNNVMRSFIKKPHEFFFVNEMTYGAGGVK